jgi:hypothetical protein
MQFEPVEGGEGEGGGENAQLVVYIDTITLGQFRISLATAHATQLTALIEHDTAAEPFAREIEQSVRTAVQAEGMPNPTLIFQPRAGQRATGESSSRSESASNPDEGRKQSVGIHPSGGVSVVAIHGAYILIRAILELDNRNR